MNKLILGVLVCGGAIGLIASLGLWRSEDPSTWKVKTTVAAPEAEGDTSEDVPEPTPPTLPPPMPVRLPATGPDPSRAALGRAKSPLVGAERARLNRARKVKVADEEILWKLEEALRNRDARAARELTRSLVRAVREKKIDSDEVVDRLIAALSSGMDALTVRGVIPQLGYLQSPKLIQFFQEQYWTTQDLATRGMYLNALRQGVDSASIPFLQQVLETEEKQNLRNQALFALSRVADDHSLGILEETVRSGSGVDQVTSLQLLSNRRDARFAPLFEQVLSRPDGAKIYETAIRGLQQVGSPSSIPVLETVRDNPDASEYVQNLARVAIRTIQQRVARKDRMAPPGSDDSE